MNFKYNINKIHGDLLSQFLNSEIKIEEKSNLKLGNYIEVSIINEGKEVKMIISKKELENYSFNWSYSENPLNENSDFVKTFDNFQLNTEVILNNIQLAETVSRMSITNDYQNFPEQNVNFVQKIRSWRLAIPRDETNPALTIKPRISDKYIDVKFSYNPLGLDKTFRLHDVLTEYSMRSKIVPR